MPNNYETTFIMTPVLTEDQVKDVVQKFEQVLSEGSAVIVHSESWGMRKLAYPIQRKSTGFYHLIQFDAEPTLIAKLETELKRDERIMRFLTVSLDKYALEFNVNRRAGKFNKKKVVESNPADKILDPDALLEPVLDPFETSAIDE